MIASPYIEKNLKNYTPRSQKIRTSSGLKIIKLIILILLITIILIMIFFSSSKKIHSRSMIKFLKESIKKIRIL